MHIYEGILSQSTAGAAVLAAGTVLTAGGTALGLAKMDYERLPRVAMLSSTFFVVSLINVPAGPTSMHLVLNGLVGLILGWAAFPALLVALFLQAVFFQFGGLTPLGVNTLNMALPAVVCYYLYHRAVVAANDKLALAAGFAAGVTGILLAALMMALSLRIAAVEFRTIGTLIVISYLGLALVEGLVTGSVVMFLRKVSPELLRTPMLPARASNDGEHQ
jgi:cobalt/nickel transport system permease protein